MNTELMAQDATQRNSAWLNRSAGQHSRRVRAGFAQIMPEPATPVSDVQSGNFWLPEPEIEPMEPMTIWDEIVFWACVGVGMGFVGAAVIYFLKV